MSLDPKLQALAEVAAAQAAAVQAFLDDPFAAIRSAPTDLVDAISTAVGFTALGTIDSHGGSGPYVINLAKPGTFSVSQVLASKETLTAADLDTGTCTVTQINSDQQIVVSAAGGWTPTDGHLIGIAS